VAAGAWREFLMAWWGEKALFLLFCFFYPCFGLDCFYSDCDNPWYLLSPTWLDFRLICYVQ
jgi:hypothetical protein